MKKTDLNKKSNGNHVINLGGVAGPLNFIKAKLELEKLGTGSILEVLLDESEPDENMAESFVRQD